MRLINQGDGSCTSDLANPFDKGGQWSVVVGIMVDRGVLWGVVGRGGIDGG